MSKKIYENNSIAIEAVKEDRYETKIYINKNLFIWITTEQIDNLKKRIFRFNR